MEQLRAELDRKTRELQERDAYIAQLEAALNERYEIIESLESQLERQTQAASAYRASQQAKPHGHVSVSKQKRVAVSAETSAHKHEHAHAQAPVQRAVQPSGK